METSWLEDFLTLAECGNFSRAAERRHMTQPALSRRIRALEDWVGASLVDRDTHQIGLTAAGERFRPIADEILRRLHLGQEEAREAADAATSTLRFAATHALALTFFPEWLRRLETTAPLGSVNLVADNMQACEQLMLQGQVQFLLCHHHPAAATVLDPHGFRSVPLGNDTLLPVSAPDGDGNPRHGLPGAPGSPVPFLAYGGTSGMGRILTAARAQSGPPAWLEPGFTSQVATALTAMARDGRGLTWAPLSLIGEDLERGSLVRAGDEAWDVEIEIRLFRPSARQSPRAEEFWSRLANAA